jgi:hypothetical protein
MGHLKFREPTSRRLFIIAHGDEGAMPQVPGIRPLDEATLETRFGLTQRH